MPTTLNTVTNHIFKNRTKYALMIAAIVAAKKTAQVAGEWKQFADEHGVTAALKSPDENHL